MSDQNIFKKLNRLKTFCNLPENASWNNYKVLKTALQCEQMDVVLFLLSAGCQVNNKSDEIGDSPLHYAVRLEDIELIQTLISKGALLTCQNHKGDTPLHVAAKSRNTKIVDLLLNYIEQTQYVNFVNNFGLTHMHIACMRNKSDIVKEFLKNGVGKDISISTDSPLWPGYTPLHFAVEFCCLDVLLLLLDYKADPHCKDIEEIDPCSLSYYKYQNASMLSYFLCRTCCNWHNLKINFLVACLGGDKDAVEKYLEHGVNVADDYEADFYTSFIFKDDTPLHCAARSESVDTVQLLLKNNADMSCVNEFGMTPLHAAFYEEESSEAVNIGVVDLLYSAYNFKDGKNITDDNGLSFFHIICFQGDNKLVKYFLKKGVDINGQVHINAKEFAGYTPLYFATRGYAPNTVKLLLQLGADINISDVKVYGTPFEFAISNDYDEVLYAIGNSGLDLNAMKNKTGQNPLHCMLQTSRDKDNIIKIFCDNGCNVNSQDNNGDSPLHCAYNERNIQSVLHLGADINIENMKGETPIISLRNGELRFYDDYDHDHDHHLIHSELYIVLLSHVEKLKGIGFYISEKNRLFIEQLFEQQAQIDPNKKCLDMKYYSGLRKQFENEIDKMKQIKIANYSSLYDILFADANQMAFHCNCKTFLDIMNLNDFDDQFPNYGYLLKLQFKKGNERKAVLGPAKDALKFILKRELPDFCSEKVFSYLIDDDLKTLIQTTTWTNMNSTKKILKPQRTRKVRKIPNELLKLFERDEDVDMLND